MVHPGATGGSGVPVDEQEAAWHSIDFQAGDVLFFHSYTIHKALPNLSGTRLRVSTDNRYQRPEDAIDEGRCTPTWSGIDPRATQRRGQALRPAPFRLRLL